MFLTLLSLLETPLKNKKQFFENQAKWSYKKNCIGIYGLSLFEHFSHAALEKEMTNPLIGINQKDVENIMHEKAIPIIAEFLLTTSPYLSEKEALILAKGEGDPVSHLFFLLGLKELTQRQVEKKRIKNFIFFQEKYKSLCLNLLDKKKNQKHDHFLIWFCHKNGYFSSQKKGITKSQLDELISLKQILHITTLYVGGFWSGKLARQTYFKMANQNISMRKLQKIEKLAQRSMPNLSLKNIQSIKKMLRLGPYNHWKQSLASSFLVENAIFSSVSLFVNAMASLIDEHSSLASVLDFDQIILSFLSNAAFLSITKGAHFVHTNTLSSVIKKIPHPQIGKITQKASEFLFQILAISAYASFHQSKSPGHNFTGYESDHWKSFYLYQSIIDLSGLKAGQLTHRPFASSIANKTYFQSLNRLYDLPKSSLKISSKNSSFVSPEISSTISAIESLNQKIQTIQDLAIISRRELSLKERRSIQQLKNEIYLLRYKTLNSNKNNNHNNNSHHNQPPNISFSFSFNTLFNFFFTPNIILVEGQKSHMSPFFPSFKQNLFFSVGNSPKSIEIENIKKQLIDLTEKNFKSKKTDILSKEEILEIFSKINLLPIVQERGIFFLKFTNKSFVHLKKTIISMEKFLKDGDLNSFFAKILYLANKINVELSALSIDTSQKPIKLNSFTHFKTKILELLDKYPTPKRFHQLRILDIEECFSQLEEKAKSIQLPNGQLDFVLKKNGLEYSLYRFIEVLDFYAEHLSDKKIIDIAVLKLFSFFLPHIKRSNT